MELQPEPLLSVRPARSHTVATNERGFTLVEAIVAMLVCTVGIMGMAQLLAVTLRMQQLGRNSTTAVRHAQDKVDELSAMSFTAAPSVQCGGSLTTNVANYNDTVTGYQRRWLVQAGPDGDLNLRQVTVRLVPDIADRRITMPYDLVTVIRGVAGAC